MHRQEALSAYYYFQDVTGEWVGGKYSITAGSWYKFLKQHFKSFNAQCVRNNLVSFLFVHVNLLKLL